MKRFFCTITVLIGMLWLIGGYDSAIATPVYNPDNGHYYEAFAGDIDWHAARDYASGSTYSGMQGHLATLTSIEENQWVWFNLGTNLSYYLLGATDEQVEGVWEWVTGEAWNFTNWSHGEPSNSYDEDSLEFWNNGQWNDILIRPGAFHHGYIVEYEERADVPEPETLILLSNGIGMIYFGKRMFCVLRI